MGQTPPKISESEWLVMEAIWQNHPVLASDLIAELGPRHDWAHNTIRTMLARLVKKGVLTYEQEGNRYVYRPSVSRSQCVKHESESFLNRVFGGATEPLLLHFAKRSKLSPKQISQLKRILEEEDKS